MAEAGQRQQTRDFITAQQPQAKREVSGECSEENCMISPGAGSSPMECVPFGNMSFSIERSGISFANDSGIGRPLAQSRRTEPRTMGRLKSR